MWPWKRRGGEVAESIARAERDAWERLRQAHGQSESIDAHASELARALPAGELYLKLAQVFRRGHS